MKHLLLAAVLSFAQVRGHYQATEARLLDRDGRPLHELRVDSQGRRLDWTPLAEISPVLVDELLRVEDHRFYEHSGVDWRSMGGALVDSVVHGRLRGGSTVTMQLAGLLDPELKAHHRNLSQKLSQMLEAREIEKTWSKPEILEAYLNLVTFHGELQGVAAASRGLFGKEPHGLDATEALLLVSLLKSPNSGAAEAAERACGLAKALELREFACSEARHRLEAALGRHAVIHPEVAWAPHLAERLLHGRHGVHVVRTTVDLDLQRHVEEALKQQLLGIREQNARDGAVLVLDNRSGKVLAYVGSSAELSTAAQVDGVQARRQAGSTLKPFIYASAFGRRLLTPASSLDDSPLDVPTALGVYRPENYDHRFHGLVSARVALASSLNIPAVRTLQLVGIDPAVETLRRLGFTALNAADFYGFSLALGSADVTLASLTNAYRTLANGGVWSEPVYEEGARAGVSRRVFSKEAAFLVSQVLSDREARSTTFGLENSLATPFWTAVKTGTSKDMRDNWCVGYSSEFTVGVWVGNFSGSSMWDVSGVDGAAPLWLDVMSWLHRRVPSHAPQVPAGVVAYGGEWFLKGTEFKPGPAREALATESRISAPSAGSVIAVDPDIPVDRQAVFLEAHPRAAALHWVIDGHELGSAGAPRFWAPEKGKHHLVLADAGGTAVDSADFSVR